MTDPPAAPPSRILVAMPTWVGDATLATPLLELIHARHPGARLDMLLKPPLGDLLSGAPWLGEVLELSRRRWPWRLVRRIASARYDWGLLLSNSLRPALLMWLGRVRRRVGYVRNGRGPFLTERLRAPARGGRMVPWRMVDFYGAIGARLGVPADGRLPVLHITAEDDRRAAALLEQHAIRADRPLLGIVPGSSYGPAKRWPWSHFAQASDALAQSHQAQVLVLGSPAEHDLADLIVAAMTRPAVDLTTARMGLATLKGVVRRLDLMITNDTGPRHLATALGVPAVCIFGPTHRTWGDCGDRRTIELQLEMDCGPRMQRRCPLEHHRCMADLTPQMVVGAATKVLATRRLSGPTPLPR